MSDRIALRVLDTLATQQWAMQEEYLRAMLEVAGREHGPALEALAARRDKPLDNTRRTTVRDGVAIVPVIGPLFRYANLFTELSGASSVQMIATDFQAALDDRTVRAIVLDVDSPGGEVNGIDEMAAMVMAARDRKPIVAHIGHLGASGAYWIASAASRVTAASTAMVGSVGAVMKVLDTRERDARSGVRTIEIVSSQSPDKRIDPSTDAGAARLQIVVDRIAEEFVAAVARQRGVSIESVLADFGRGGVLVGADAARAGMVDGVSTLESVLASLAADRAGPRPFITLENRMAEITTVAALRAAYPTLVGQIETDAAAKARTEGEAAGRTAGLVDGEKAGREAGLAEGKAAGMVEGATNERARILAIQAHAVPGAENLVADLVADGKTTADQAGARILAELKAQGPRALEALRGAEPKNPGAGATGTGAGATTLTVEDASKQIAAEMKAAEEAGAPISFAEAGSRIRARQRSAA